MKSRVRRNAGSRIVMVVSDIAGKNESSAISKSPIYAPTPSNRELRTPHSGLGLLCTILDTKFVDTNAFL